MLAKRLASALILIPIVGLALWAGGLSTLALASAVAVTAGLEYLHLLRRDSLSPPYAVTLGALLLPIVDAQWPQLRLAASAFVFVPLIGLSIEAFRHNAPGSMSRWAHGVAGGLYVGLPLACLIRLRSLDQGFDWLVVALVGTWICDTAAYFVGCTLGRRKLAPVISPKKTWEGAAGGLVAGAASVAALGAWLLGLSVWQGMLFGIALVAAATVGDLAESVIKRQVGVKDSGNMIPGHGGMLDRIDSLLFVIPLTYLLATLFTAAAG